MSQQPQLLPPELQQLLDDSVSVHQRYVELSGAFVEQQIELEKEKAELQNATQELSAMRQKERENEGIVKSYNQLKLDYESMRLEYEKQRQEIRTENKTHVQELEDELKAARVRATEQAELHQNRVTQIVADYEAKLHDADEKIRQLNRVRSSTPWGRDVYKNSEYSPAALIKETKGPRGGTKRWPPLNVAVESNRGSSTRGRGRSRGAPSKRKLFKVSNENPVDVE